MANAGSTALRESNLTTTSTSSVKWEIEPRVRVTPSHTLSSLNELIYITDSIIPLSTTDAISRVDDDSDGDDEGWQCDCTTGCNVTNSDECECVSTFGNFYTYPGTAELPGILNLDALPANIPLVECGPTCPCDEGCSNRITQRGLKVPIHVKPINDIGFGAFYNGTQTLERGTFISLYAGEFLSTPEANDRWSNSNKKKGEGNYILSLKLPNQRIHIDPRFKGNVGRFFNHSCDPTCLVQVVRWGGDSIWPRAAIFEEEADEKAKREIEEGEELTYDYADASGNGNVVPNTSADEGLTRCLCGAGNCRGWMPFDPDVN